MSEFHPTNTATVLERVTGNREAIGLQCLDANGDIQDLTGRTVTLRMVAEDGTAKLAAGAATLADAKAGKVSYTPEAADVDTAGRFAVYAIDDSTPPRRWPATPVLILHLTSEAP